MKEKSLDDQYSAKEIERRVKAAVQGAFKTLPKPLKSMTLKGAPAQSKKKLKKKNSTFSSLDEPLEIDLLKPPLPWRPRSA